MKAYFPPRNQEPATNETAPAFKQAPPRRFCARPHGSMREEWCMTTVNFPTPSVHRNRHRLPNRRQSQLIRTTFRGCNYTLTISRFESGALAEVFCDPTKIGSDAAADASDASILISLALQH